MTRVAIIIDVADEHADPEHAAGLTNDAYERLTAYPLPLGWLGEIYDVERVEDE